MNDIRIDIPARTTYLTEYHVDGLAFGGRVEADTVAEAQIKAGPGVVVVGRLAASYSGPAMSDAVANEILAAIDESPADRWLT